MDRRVSRGIQYKRAEDIVLILKNIFTVKRQNSSISRKRYAIKWGNCNWKHNGWSDPIINESNFFANITLLVGATLFFRDKRNSNFFNILKPC